jgi:hypothetical protein
MRYFFLSSTGYLFLAGTLLACGALAQSGQSTPPAQSQDSSTSPAADKPKDGQANSGAKKVYTNDDLKTMHGDSLSVVGTTGSQKKPATSNNTKNEQREQAYWHNRAQKLRSQIAEVDAQIAQITHDNSQTDSGGGAGATAGSNPIYFGGQGVRLNNLRGRKASIEKQLDDLAEEARKAGVPPGWLR